MNSGMKVAKTTFVEVSLFNTIYIYTLFNINLKKTTEFEYSRIKVIYFLKKKSYRLNESEFYDLFHQNSKIVYRYQFFKTLNFEEKKRN